MYAIIEDSGQQFKVSAGDLIRVDIRDLAEDAKQLTFDKVLLVSGDDGAGKVGTPMVAGAKVIADIVQAEVKGDKITTIKYRRRKGTHRRIGHRQKYVEVKIAEIVA